MTENDHATLAALGLEAAIGTLKTAEVAPGYPQQSRLVEDLKAALAVVLRLAAVVEAARALVRHTHHISPQFVCPDCERGLRDTRAALDALDATPGGDDV